MLTSLSDFMTGFGRAPTIRSRQALVFTVNSRGLRKPGERRPGVFINSEVDDSGLRPIFALIDWKP